MDSVIEFPNVAALDDLIERAKRGVVATTAIDLIKDKLTRMKNDAYRDMLNEKDPSKVLDHKSYLLGIERLAKALLVDEAHGKMAYEHLLGVSGKTEAEVPILVPRTASKTRRQRAAGPIAK